MAHQAHIAVCLNGLVYVGGGYEVGYKPSYTIDCYDPVNNSWSSSINIPYALFTMTTLNTLVTAGGKDENFFKVTNQILTMDAGQLKNYTKMETARSQATATGYQGVLIITGGMDDTRKTLSSTELLDTNNDQWYKCNDLPQPHRELQSVIVDNILYLLGGFGEDSRASKAVFTTPLDTLSTHQLNWSTSQPAPLRSSAPVCVNGTQLLAVGGIEGFTITNDVHKLNRISHNWEAIGHIPSERWRSVIVSTADNRVIVIGGVNDKGEGTNTVWIGSCEPK